MQKIRSIGLGDGCLSEIEGGRSIKDIFKSQEMDTFSSYKLRKEPFKKNEVQGLRSQNAPFRHLSGDVMQVLRNMDLSSEEMTTRNKTWYSMAY